MKVFSIFFLLLIAFELGKTKYVNEISLFVNAIGGQENVQIIQQLMGIDVVKTIKKLLRYEKKSESLGKFVGLIYFPIIFTL